MNYNNKTFRPLKSSENSNTSIETIFLYKQQGTVVTATYHGGEIATGHLIGTVNRKGVIMMHYHHIDTHGNLQTVTCTSTPEILPNGKIILHESWQWTSGDRSKGYSQLEEL